jgi:DNA-directed RNA polymerase subunit M/transcription elongation factor TFIIS
MYICLNCGNENEFRREITYREYTTETAIIDGQSEEEIDYVDHEVSDSERTDDGDLTCNECSETDVESLDKNSKEYWELKWEHTDKKGKWHVEELDEKKRDKNILLEAGVELL